MATCLFTILTYIKWLWIKVNVNYKLKETIKIWTGYHSRIFTTKNKTILPQQPAIADQLSLHVLRTLANSVCYIKSWLQFIYAGICRRLSLACYLYFLLKWDLRGCVVSLCHVTFLACLSPIWLQTNVAVVSSQEHTNCTNQFYVYSTLTLMPGNNFNFLIKFQ